MRPPRRPDAGGIVGSGAAIVYNVVDEVNLSGVAVAPIYTRTGDKGFTLLPGAKGSGPLRVRKSDPRVVALGELDELNTVIGLCASAAEAAGNDAIRRKILAVQDNLLRAGTVLAAAMAGDESPVKIESQAVRRMERSIDTITAKLPPLKSLIVPGGCELAGRLHVARAAARRAERSVAAAIELIQHSGKPGSPPAIVARYLNRLSDFLFTLARQANHVVGADEHTWNP